jgi:hypothetical protein
MLSALLASGGLTLLLTFYRRPFDAIYGRMETSDFDVEGIVPLAYVLFALGLGLAVGVVWRRTAPSIVVAQLGYIGGRIFVDSWLRQRLTTPLTATWGFHAHGPRLDKAWILWQGPSDRAGHPFRASPHVLDACVQSVGAAKSVAAACLARHGAGFNHAVYIPANRFWPLQGVEAALFAGIGGVLITFAAWWLLRRAD